MRMRGRVWLLLLAMGVALVLVVVAGRIVPALRGDGATAGPSRPAAGVATPSPLGERAATGALPSPAGAGADQAPVPEQASRGSLPAGFERVAESSRLVLGIDRQTSEIAVVDKSDGYTWLSNPADVRRQNLGDTLEKELQSELLLTYTDANRQISKLTTDKWERTTVAYEPIGPSGALAGGVRVTYTFPAEQISLAMVYRLADTYLDVTIPDSSLIERSSNLVVSVAPLPFFGAAGDDASGYMLLPDGSGALARFRKVHPEYLGNFSREAFGPDAYTFQPVYEQPVCMPAFGMVVGSNAFFGLVTQGQFDVNVTASPSGYTVNYNRTGPELLYRRQAALIRRRGAQPVNRYDAERIVGDRQVRYTFLSGGDASYVGMAKVYRDYLVREVGVAPVQSGEARMDLHIFQGIERKGLFFPDFVSMTTFPQAADILRALRERGVTSLDVTLEGWASHGYAGEYPHGSAPDGRLGGSSGLEDLVRSASQEGAQVYLQKDYLDIYKGDRSFSANQDIVRAANQLPLYDGARTFLLNPDVALAKFVPRDVAQDASWHVDGFELQHLGDTVLYDSNRSHPLTRQQFVQASLAIADEARKQTGHVRIVGANVYALGHADALIGVPITSSGYPFADETVPFYELVVHGLVPYTGTEANRWSDPRVDFLRQLESGAVPSFELTAESSEALRKTSYNVLTSSAAPEWIDEVARQYRQVVADLGRVQGQRMTDHEQLAPGVFRTTYADGTGVVVNYNPAPFTIGATRIEPYGYAVETAGQSDRSAAP